MSGDGMRKRKAIKIVAKSSEGYKSQVERGE